VSGSARDITLYGAPVLHQHTAEVTDFGPELHRLVADMFASMYAASGVGLAANQIGVGLRVFVMDCPDSAGGPNVVAHVVNPVLELPPPPRGLEVAGEGCLSVPGQRFDVARTVAAAVTGVDMHGAPVRVEGTGLVARCLQPPARVRSPRRHGLRGPAHRQGTQEGPESGRFHRELIIGHSYS
jgi:peptide deformylase